MSDWIHQAACAGHNPDLWDTDRLRGETRADMRRRHHEALAICQACPVRRACLRAAVEAERGERIRLGEESPTGIRGGTMPSERSGRRRRYVDLVAVEEALRGGLTMAQTARALGLDRRAILAAIEEHGTAELRQLAAANARNRRTGRPPARIDLVEVEVQLRLGATAAQTAQRLGVGATTLRRTLCRHPDLKAIADHNGAVALAAARASRAAS